MQIARALLRTTLNSERGYFWDDETPSGRTFSSIMLQLNPVSISDYTWKKISDDIEEIGFHSSGSGSFIKIKFILIIY